MAKRVHESARRGYEVGHPAGMPSASCEAKVVDSPVEQPRKEVTPRVDVDKVENRFQRGAKRVWNKVRPRATRS